MKRYSVILLSAVLVLTSLMCNLPFEIPVFVESSSTPQTSGGSVIGDDLLAAAKQMSGDKLSTFDDNKDGKPDRTVYQFAVQQAMPGVDLYRSLESRLATGSLFERKIILRFKNTTNKEAAFSFEEVIPKELASNVSKIKFSLQPARIINPDPDVVFNVALGAGVDGVIEMLVEAKKEAEFDANWDAYVYGYQYCLKQPAGDKQGVCLAVLAKIFKGNVPQSLLEHTCDKADNNWKITCEAIITGKLDTCKEQSAKRYREFCYAHTVDSLCGGELTVDAKENCIFDKATQVKSELACTLLTKIEEKAHCLAIARNDKELCKSIKDDARRTRCEKGLAGLDTSSYAIGDWFPASEQEATCKNIIKPLANYKYVRYVTLYAINCEYVSVQKKPYFTMYVDLTLFLSDAAADEKWKEMRAGELKSKDAIARKESDYLWTAWENTTVQIYNKLTPVDGSPSFSVRHWELYLNSIIHIEEFGKPSNSDADIKIMAKQIKMLIDQKRAATSNLSPKKHCPIRNYGRQSRP